METRLILEAVNAAVTPGRRQADARAVFDELTERAPWLKNDANRWEVFTALLTAAEAEDLVILPASNGNGWNYNVSPARPNWVRLFPVKETKSTFNHQGFPWNPALAFLAGEKWLPTGIKDAAQAIQKFLTNGGPGRPLVPIKERSFHIFADEKRLEGLQHSDILFGRGKISLELLRCYVVEPTPVTERFEHGNEIIIIENEATFDSFCRLAKHKPLYRLVVYGRGNEILKCASYLQRQAIEHNVAEISYFGDVDLRGIEIPHFLAKQLSKGPKIVPLVHAYNALLHETPPSCDQIPRACTWLPESLSARAATVVAESRRIPQEAFGWEQIQAFLKEPTA